MPQLPREEEGPRGEPRIGTDEWVASVEERRQRPETPLARVQAWLAQFPALALLGVAVASAALFPLLPQTTDFHVRVAINALLFALLALGLNVVVGYAGLLDLGYIAFYGFGAYAYALLSSNQFDLHWPTWATVPLVVVATAALGFLLGLPSRRLLGDYLAIVTLFFAQIFVVFTTNANRIALPWSDEPFDVTGGPNGIAGVDPFVLFGWEAVTVTDYFYIALAAFALVFTAFHFLSASRTGRAWRALREDPLAAELMSMPVNRLKLLAFAFGAATAGLSGSIFAAVQIGVFPQNFDLPLLITLYAMVILGGAGSMAGVVLGAVTITVLLEVLRDAQDSRYVFYGLILLTLVARLRPWRLLGAVLGATVFFGLLVTTAVGALWPRGTERGSVQGEGLLADVLSEWVLLPSQPGGPGNVGFVLLVVAVIALTQVRGIWRLAGLVPTLYLAAFAWENRLVFNPSITRLLLLGSLLVILMNARPQGLFGTPRVEIV